MASKHHKLDINSKEYKKINNHCTRLNITVDEYFHNPDLYPFIRAKKEDVLRGRDRWLKRNYDILEKDYNKMFWEQDGRCAICRKHQTELKKTLSVDHNHITGKVRGLLCHNCNMAIGLFKENKNNLLCAINYLDFTL